MIILGRNGNIECKWLWHKVSGDWNVLQLNGSDGCTTVYLLKKLHCTLVMDIISSSQFNSVQLLSRVRLFVTPWIAAHQASLSITNSQSLLKLMSIELVMPFNHLILCRPLLLLPLVLPSIRVFSNESTRLMSWPKYWSFSLSISPSNKHPVQKGWQTCPSNSISCFVYSRIFL